ncbi:mast cell carboxypeptidase A-like isoform X1 [Xenopus laevis]|uniref:Mast cell carboxypeptidase A-like isoform X1 n=1 Tax=Xenopus laevis TaxID=8355 RepID=A0A8J1KPT9_XENLA|nr:mast cell carboxypeptidase A-like isoform X1 [Xenopus laevis]
MYKAMNVLLIWVCGLATSAVLAKQTFHGDKVFRVKLQTEEHVALIHKMKEKIKLDFWHPDTADRMVPHMDADFRVNSDQAHSVSILLEQFSVPYEVLFHDLQEGIDAQLDNKKIQKSKGHSYTKYNTWEKIVEWTGNLAKKYPNLVKKVDIGKTVEGRPMYVLQVGNANSATKAIFMDCGIHAREWISPAFCQWFVKELIKGKNNIRELVKSLTFYILPVFNIDGYVWTWTEDRMWRKNRSPSDDGNCVGTDLNRNFNISWCDIGSSTEPCSEIYCGATAESEIEAKNVANFIRSHVDSIKAYISIHSYSQMLLYPFSYTYNLAPDHKELDEIAKGAVSELKGLYGTSYTYGPSASTIYPTAGSSDDWAYSVGIKYSFTFELRDKGKKGFLLPQSQIKATCQESTLAVAYIAKYVLAHSS